MIIEYIGDVAETGSMLARHIGSSFGLRNDFGSGGKDDNRNDDSGFSCTGINGLMDYYWCDGFFSCLLGWRDWHDIDKFTQCSKEDLQDFYDRTVQTHNSFCLTCGKHLKIFIVIKYRVIYPIK